MTSGAAAWTTVADVISRLRSRWMGGRYLAAYASGGEWQPVSFPIRGPAAGELLERLDEVQNWLTRVNRDLRRFPGLRVEAKAIQGRRVGSNEVPARLWVDSYAALLQILGVSDEVAEFDELARLTREVVPELTDWVASHPRTVLEHSSIWPRLVSVVRWIADRDVSMLYARQVDVAGVDTKLIEQYKLILGRLLEAVLPGERIDHRYSRSHFEGRFGLRRRPDYTRLRFLAPQHLLPTGVSEVTLRTQELAALDPGVGHVIIVENEISFLALPNMPDTVAIFGSGFAIGSVAGLVWLQDKMITYWGDIDSYGFVILNRLRARFPHVRSILMDIETLLAHPLQWVSEEQPSNQALPHLTEVEAETYQALVEDRFGHHVRLEQERVRFSLVREALNSCREVDRYACYQGISRGDP
jgi:hypothetical protein